MKAIIVLETPDFVRDKEKYKVLRSALKSLDASPANQLALATGFLLLAIRKAYPKNLSQVSRMVASALIGIADELERIDS